MRFLMIHYLDEAVAIASRHPTARIGVFELREILS